MGCEKYEKHECTKCNSDKKIVAQEKKSKFVLNNPGGKKVCKIKYDGCYDKSKEKKCDFLLLVCEEKNEKAFFIELKGQNFTQALKQIQKSIDNEIRILKGFEIHARIVVTRFNAPNYQNTPEYKKLFKMIKKTGGKIDKKSQQFTEEL